MIEINKDNKIKHEKLEGDEILYFMSCLIKEKIRHEKEIESNIHIINYFSTTLQSIFWDCQIKRHRQDIEDINKTLKYLCSKIEGWYK
ncbi:MAG: hypothetical protein MUO82_10775 [Candidatus Thermoplasmatota archaeon]|nr:hypothetical protein [Candidatus Thermoplasmatota archaeon]